MPIKERLSSAADDLDADRLVFAREPMRVGRLVAVTRHLRCDWTEPQPRSTSDDFHRVLMSEVLATDGSAVSALAVE